MINLYSWESSPQGKGPCNYLVYSSSFSLQAVQYPSSPHTVEWLNCVHFADSSLVSFDIMGKSNLQNPLILSDLKLKMSWIRFYSWSQWSRRLEQTCIPCNAGGACCISSVQQQSRGSAQSVWTYVLADCLPVRSEPTLTTGLAACLRLSQNIGIPPPGIPYKQGQKEEGVPWHTRLGSGEYYIYKCVG